MNRSPDTPCGKRTKKERIRITPCTTNTSFSSRDIIVNSIRSPSCSFDWEAGQSFIIIKTWAGSREKPIDFPFSFFCTCFSSSSSFQMIEHGWIKAKKRNLRRKKPTSIYGKKINRCSRKRSAFFFHNSNNTGSTKRRHNSIQFNYIFPSS